MQRDVRDPSVFRGEMPEQRLLRGACLRVLQGFQRLPESGHRLRRDRLRRVQQLRLPHFRADPAAVAPSAHGEKDPVQEGSRGADFRHGSRPVLRLSVQGRKKGVRIIRGGRQDQFFLRAGHRHIEDPQLLAQALCLQMAGKDLLFYGGPLHREKSVPDIRRKAEFRIADDKLGRISDIKLLVHACQEHHRELQSLGLVDAQDPHRASGSGSGCLPEIPVVFFQGLDVSHKVKQAPVTGLFVVRCLGDQHIQVRAAHRAPGKGRGVVIIAGLLQHIPEKGGDAEGNCLVRRMPDQREAAAKLRRSFRIPLRSADRLQPVIQGKMRAPFRRLRSFRFCCEKREFLVRQSAERGMEDRCQGNVVQRVIRGAEKAQDSPDLQRVKISLTLFRHRRDPFSGQSLHILLCPAAEGPEQDHDVSVSQGPQGSRFPVTELESGVRVRQFPDPSGNKSCLDLRPFLVAVTGRGGCEKQLSHVFPRAFRSREFRAGIKRGVAVIQDPACLRGHQL